MSPRVSSLAAALAFAGASLSLSPLGHAQEGRSPSDGEVSIRTYDAAALLTEGDAYVEIVGRRAGGRPVGEWTFAFGELRAADVAEVRDLRYHVAVDGERRRTRGAFVDGLPSGAWATVTERIRRSDPADTLFSSAFDYVDGAPQQAFRLAGAGAELLGFVSRDGLAEDGWALFGADGAGEEWRFYEGRLQEVVYGGEAIAVLDDYTGDTLQVALDEDYLAFLSVYQQLGGRPAASVEGRIADLLVRNAATQREVDEALAALGARGPGGQIRVAVPSLPLTSKEVTRLQRLSASLSRFRAEADALLGDGGLRRVAGIDEEAAFLRAAVAELQRELVAPAYRLDTAYRRGILRSLPRAAYLRLLYPEGGADGAVAVDFDGSGGVRQQIYAGPDARRFDVSAEGLAGVSAIVDYALASVGELRGRLAGKLEAVGARTPDLTADVSRLEATYARLDSLVGAQPRRVTRELHLDRVRVLAQAQVATYRDLDALGRQQQLPGLNACLDRLYALAVALRNLPAREARIEDAYTDEVWNNIISTVMTERVKKRVTEAYRERLVPYFLARAADELTCENAAALETEMTAAYERVLALRDADTEQLEEDLRGVRDPQRVLALLGVTPLN